MRDALPGVIYTALFFIGVLTIFVTLYLRLKKTDFKQNKKWDTFFEEEREASFITKRESIPSSLLWTINTRAIPKSSHVECKNAYEKVIAFEEVPLADLRAYSNIQLKKEFGINHLEELILAEQRYLQCMQTLVEYGLALKENGFLTDSKEVFLYALDKKCDKKDCYLSLIEIYAIMQDKEGLVALESIAHQSKQHLVYYEKIISTLKNAYTTLM